MDDAARFALIQKRRLHTATSELLVKSNRTCNTVTITTSDIILFRNAQRNGFINGGDDTPQNRRQMRSDITERYDRMT